MGKRTFRRCVVVMVVVLAALPAAASAADPFVLFLLRMLRDQAISSALESAAKSTPQAARPPAAVFSLPPAETDRMRRLIDESFVHLRPEQRHELHSSLMRMLDDPKNASQRGEILAAFTARAEATRQAHVQLSRLTDDQMRTVASEARVEFARLPPDQRREMLQALERGVPGMPRTLHEMILAEFRSVAAAR